MSSQIFMRGQLDLSQNIGYYLVGKSTDGTYYTYIDAPAASQITSGGPASAVFVSLKYTLSSNWSPKTIFINALTPVPPPGIYNFSTPPAGGTSPVNIIVVASSTTATSGGVLDVPTVVPPAGAPIKLVPDPSTNVGTLGLWSGVWYTPTDVNGLPYSWKTLAVPTLDPPVLNVTFRGVTQVIANTPPGFQIMLIPRDAGTNGSISVWTGGQCQIPSGNNVSLVLWSQWVDGDIGSPVNCDGPGWLAGSSTVIQGADGCVFASVQDCKAAYLYTLCPSTGTCGNCLGVCATGAPVGAVCVHDYTADLQSNNKSPLSCTPQTPTPQTVWDIYGPYLIIVIVIAFLLVGGLISLFFFTLSPPTSRSYGG